MTPTDGLTDEFIRKIMDHFMDERQATGRYDYQFVRDSFAPLLVAAEARGRREAASALDEFKREYTEAVTGNNFATTNKLLAAAARRLKTAVWPSNEIVRLAAQPSPAPAPPLAGAQPCRCLLDADCRIHAAPTEARLREALGCVDDLERAAIAYCRSKTIPIESQIAGFQMMADSLRAALRLPAPAAAPVEPIPAEPSVARPDVETPEWTPDYALANVRLRAARGRSFGCSPLTPQSAETVLAKRTAALDDILAYCAKAGHVGSILRAASSSRSSTTEQE